jgi:hypothetical protein
MPYARPQSPAGRSAGETGLLRLDDKLDPRLMKLWRGEPKPTTLREIDEYFAKLRSESSKTSDRRHKGAGSPTIYKPDFGIINSWHRSDY